VGKTNRQWESLIVEENDSGVIRLKLNRADKKNALSQTLIEELTEFSNTIGSAPSTRVVHLSGEGSVFCAGGDLEWMRQAIQSDRAGRIRQATELAMMLNALNTMASPLIASVQGGAYGGGAGLCCVCDEVIAEEGTRFGFTETKLGLIPGTISPYVLARLGEGAARRVFMSARTFDAAEAYALGLVSKVVNTTDMDSAVMDAIEPYLHTAPGATAAAKALARSLGPVIDQSTIERSVKQLADVWETDEAKQGIDAFLNKVKPPWT